MRRYEIRYMKKSRTGVISAVARVKASDAYLARYDMEKRQSTVSITSIRRIRDRPSD